MKRSTLRGKPKRQRKKRRNKRVQVTISVLRTIGLISVLIVAGAAIYLEFDSPGFWIFLGYAIGSSSAGIQSI